MVFALATGSGLFISSVFGSVYFESEENILTLLMTSLSLTALSSDCRFGKVGNLSNSNPLELSPMLGGFPRCSRIFFLSPQPPTTRSRYCVHDLAVPKTRYVTKEVVTPGMKKRISEIAPCTLKSGSPARALLAEFIALNTENAIVAASNIL